MLREGIEDWEYFVFLDNLLNEYESVLDTTLFAAAQNLLSVPDAIFSDARSEFTDDPKLLDAQRNSIGEMVKFLQILSLILARLKLL